MLGRLPPLVTASPPSAAAILGPSTVVLFGGDRPDTQVSSGGRFVLGGWLNHEHTCGLEASYLFLNPHSISLRGSSSRSFFDSSPLTTMIKRWSPRLALATRP